MEYIVNSREMKEYDRNTTEYFKIPSAVLMERAALAFTEELVLRKTDISNVLVVCGSGNNGGDGLAAARMLMQRGSRVDVILADGGGRFTEQNKIQQEILLAYGVQILQEIPSGTQYTLVVDALFGVGLSRPVEGQYAALIGQMNAAGGMKAAVDIASGISSDDGRVLGTAFHADLTVTFAYRKTGMLLWPGNEYSGEIVVKDIGIDERSWLGQKPALSALTDADCRFLYERVSHSNKGTFGKLLIIAGSVNMAGAAVLCGRAAYAAGCGLVRILTPEENRMIIQTALPEAVLSVYRADDPGPEVVKEALKWADAVVLGPGIGTSAAARQIVDTVLQNVSVPVLLDADALNLISENRGILQNIRAGAVFTPHLGEMSRLTNLPVPDIQGRLISVAEEFAEQYRVVCVLKDEHTVTAAPDRRTWLNLSGNSGMATAGSGDVLSGITGSFLAQGMKPEAAAPYGVYVHGRAGDLILRETGKRGLTATDLIRGLRRFWALDPEKIEKEVRKSVSEWS